MPDQTQNQSGTAAGAPASSDGAQSAGSSSNQPANNQTVDSGRGAEDTRNNSGRGDGGDGSDGGEDQRRRPTRVERRFSKLTSGLRKTEELEAENQRLSQVLSRADLSGVNIPEYKEGEEVTPERLQRDIVNAAAQIVDLKMGQVLPEFRNNLSQAQASEKAVAEIEAATAAHPELQPDNEAYDADLESYLADTFEAAFKGNPNFSFKKLADETFKLRGRVTRTQDNGSDAGAKNDNRSRGAIVASGGGSKTGGKSVDEMSSDEYLAYVASGGK